MYYVLLYQLFNEGQQKERLTFYARLPSLDRRLLIFFSFSTVLVALPTKNRMITVWM
jgi:hypothetical protein